MCPKAFLDDRWVRLDRFKPAETRQLADNRIRIFSSLLAKQRDGTVNVLARGGRREPEPTCFLWVVHVMADLADLRKHIRVVSLRPGVRVQAPAREPVLSALDVRYCPREC